MRQKSQASRRIRLRASMRVTDEAFVSGETYVVHLPIPAACAQQTDIRLLRFSHEPFLIAPDTALQRTVCFRETLADLARQEPHMRFSPYLRHLAEEPRAGESRRLAIAQRFYDYITNHVRYSYMRAYLQIDDAADFAALNLKRGIAACRRCSSLRSAASAASPRAGKAALLPSRVTPAATIGRSFMCRNMAGCLPIVRSYGGGGKRRGDEERRRFYFGNLDAYRMVANRVYQADFDPTKQ